MATMYWLVDVGMAVVIVVVAIVVVVAVGFFMVVVGEVLVVTCMYNLGLSLGAFGTLAFVAKAAAVVVLVVGTIVSCI